ncbi:MAG: hypothetical protein ACJ76L_13365 [Conexibacter sp.]
MIAERDSRLDVPVAVCGVRFSHATYYEDGELLYLTKGIPLGAADGDTPEGHTVFVGDSGRVVGLLIQCPAWWLDKDGTLNVTLRDGGPTTKLDRESVERLLAAQVRY